MCHKLEDEASGRAISWKMRHQVCHKLEDEASGCAISWKMRHQGVP